MRGALLFALLLAACGGDEFSSGNGGGGSGGNSQGGSGGSVSGGGSGANPSGGNAGSGGSPSGGVGGGEVGGAAGVTGNGGGCGNCTPTEPLCCENQCLGLDGNWTVTSRACDGNSVLDNSTVETWKFENGTLKVVGSDADCKATYTGTYTYVPPKQLDVTYSAVACTPAGCHLGAEQNTCIDASVSISLNGEVEVECSTAKISIFNSDVCGGTGTLVVEFTR
jgi:hypothetical protein